MSPEEARLAITDVLVDLLVDLGTEDPDATDADLLDLEESMGDVAALIMETFDLKVLGVEGSTVTVELTIP